MKLILVFYGMIQNIPLEFIGKHINTVPEAEHYIEGIYTIDTNDQYLNQPYNMLFLFTDERGIINSVSFYVDIIIDKSFYLSMVEKHGEPDKMYKKGNKTLLDKTQNNDEFFEAEGYSYDLQQCNFEESPVFIIWNKPKYNIEVIIGDTQDSFHKTRIIFGKGFLQDL
ncbi:hypothetical protein M0D21_07890 [Aquimarina sp. D1M17]|uniref:hypothetical protein n=1 Tax=Aquimarina acroporae TaxID=2937283 RepID=UPI0020BE5F86|nr:hypothetical protein [Aquimarina acroporae]MCK8521484.1 hypothetical protein [Aquimarina acroporae]